MAADLRAFNEALLKRAGYPVTPENLRFLETWQRFEGGWTNNDASFNPLNTTKNAPGAIRSINSVGVKKFDSLQRGIDATLATIRNGRYPDIDAGLKDGNPYDNPIADDLSVWVSGKPTGENGAAYAKRVMGTSYSPPKPGQGKGKVVGSPPSSVPAGGFSAPPGASGDPRQAVLAMLMQRNAATAMGRPDMRPGFGSILQALSAFRAQRAGGPTETPPTAEGSGQAQTTYSGKGVLKLPTTWKGTHNTDGLTPANRNTAIDIMGKAGTPVVVPFDGVVEKIGSAQGGESMYLRAANGKRYWLGHVDPRIKSGTKFKAGNVIARNSADLATPHAHWDSL